MNVSVIVVCLFFNIFLGEILRDESMSECWGFGQVPGDLPWGFGTFSFHQMSFTLWHLFSAAVASMCKGVGRWSWMLKVDIFTKKTQGHRIETRSSCFLKKIFLLACFGTLSRDTGPTSTFGRSLINELQNHLLTTWNLCTLVEIRILKYFSLSLMMEFWSRFWMLAEVCTLCFHLICSSKSDSNGLTGAQTHGEDTFPGLHGLCDSELQPALSSGSNTFSLQIYRNKINKQLLYLLYCKKWSAFLGPFQAHGNEFLDTFCCYCYCCCRSVAVAVAVAVVVNFVVCC